MNDTVRDITVPMEGYVMVPTVAVVFLYVLLGILAAVSITLALKLNRNR